MQSRELGRQGTVGVELLPQINVYVGIGKEISLSMGFMKVRMNWEGVGLIVVSQYVRRKELHEGRACEGWRCG